MSSGAGVAAGAAGPLPPVSVCDRDDGARGRPADPWPIPPLFAQLVDDTSLLRPRATAPGSTRSSPGTWPPGTAATAASSGSSSARCPGCPRSSPSWRGPPRRGRSRCRWSSTPGWVRCRRRCPRCSPGRACSRRAPSRRPRRPTSTPSGWSGWRSSCRRTSSRWSSRAGRQRAGRPTARGWLDAVRRVAEHGCAPKLRCGGSPGVRRAVAWTRSSSSCGWSSRPGAGSRRSGAAQVVRADAGTAAQHGMLNLLVAVARALADGDVARAPWRTPTVRRSPTRLASCRRATVQGVAALLPRCGADPEPVPAAELSGLGLLG